MTSVKSWRQEQAEYQLVGCLKDGYLLFRWVIRLLSWNVKSMYLRHSVTSWLHEQNSKTQFYISSMITFIHTYPSSMDPSYFGQSFHPSRAVATSWISQTHNDFTFQNSSTLVTWSWPKVFEAGTQSSSDDADRRLVRPATKKQVRCT